MKRFYGSDSTEEFDVLVEATEQEDGALYYEVVMVEHEGPSTT